MTKGVIEMKKRVLKMVSNPMAMVITVSMMLVTAMGLTNSVQAQDRGIESPRVSPNAVVSQTIGTTDVVITYGRPAVRDRIIFGELVPFGEIWRTGANEATTISFSNDVLFEGEPVEAGIYSLFTIPRDEDEWTIVLNNIADQWGAYDYNVDQDVVRVNVEAEEALFMEQMMFYFEEIDENSGTAVLHWDTTKVPFQITVDR